MLIEKEHLLFYQSLILENEKLTGQLMYANE